MRYKPGMMGRPHLLGMLPEELVAHLAGAGTRIGLDEARRILSHVITHARPGFPTARPVGRAVTERVATLTERDGLEVVEHASDPDDGFVKLLLRSRDGALSEAVRIPLRRQGCFTVCLSSQVGCSLGCVFCATGGLGLDRSLATWEMVSAFCLTRDHAPGRVTGAVFMGQGEPLANYEAVIAAARILSNPCGGRIRAEAISISTAGLIGGIRRFTAERHPYRLIVSLTSAIQSRRDALLPAMAAQPLTELALALREHQAVTGTRLTLAWVVLAGVNTGQDEVDALGRLLEGVPFQLDLIDVNESGVGGFSRATARELDSFRDRLRTLGVPVVRRYAGGANVHAACGMLASRRATTL